MKKAPRKKKVQICRLREIRDLRQKSIVALAHESGVDSLAIIHIEQGRGEGRPSAHLKLAEALGVSLDEYFGYGTFRPVTGEGDRVTHSGPSGAVEELRSLPRSPLSVKRIHLAPRKSLDLTRELDSAKPIFFYLVQGEGKVWRGKTWHALKPGEHFGVHLPGRVRLENTSSVPSTFLLIQT